MMTSAWFLQLPWLLRQGCPDPLQVLAGLGVVGIDAQCRFKLRHRLAQAPLRGIHHAEVVARLCVVRLDADRPLQMRLGLGELLLSAECHPQHVERAHVVGIDLNRVLQFRHVCRPASLKTSGYLKRK